MQVAQRPDYHLVDDLRFFYKILKIPNFAGGFLVTIIFDTGLTLSPDFTEMNTDVDLIFIAV